jgi:hypothetical protein
MNSLQSELLPRKPRKRRFCVDSKSMLFTECQLKQFLDILLKDIDTINCCGEIARNIENMVLSSAWQSIRRRQL